MSSLHYVAGIDFGTTNSAVSVSDGGVPRMVQIAPNCDTIPTALFFDESSRHIFIGHDAYKKYREPFSEGRLMRSLKRILGTPTMSTGTQIYGKYTKFEDIVGYFVQHLKEKLDDFVNHSVTDVIMGRPVHFRDNDSCGDDMAQQQLERIARNVGFKNIGFQYEPIAAAFAHERNLTSEHLAMVIDIGGGTSDFTVIRLGAGLMNKLDRTDDILANTGIRIGGNDFDYAFAIDKFMPEYGLGSMYRSGDKILPVPNAPYIDLATWSSVNHAYTPQVWNLMRGVQIGALAPDKIRRMMDILENNLGHANLDFVESAKISLSAHDEITQRLDFLDDCPVVTTCVADFVHAISADVAKINNSMNQCLAMAQIKNTDISLIILTGGSTQIPYVVAMLRGAFPNAVISDSNKMASVGLGLAYDAIRRFAE
ncbi:MAG: Hsp70 family protein [Alphaproteobacteria bacterium]|nr:Hsp70 family protein [Alphaproteobacteria bacterium]